MAKIPTNPDYVWNYSFCELVDLGVEIDDDWYSVGNIDYDTLDDLQVDFQHLFEDAILGQLDKEVLVPENGWDEINQEFTEHGPCEFMEER
jgi:hypothetical protein